MKCLYHPNKNAAALLNREFEKHFQKIPFQIGVCIDCQKKWADDLIKEGWK